MANIRSAAVAGRFYAADKGALDDAVRAHLRCGDAKGKVPKAVIAPHAGYMYSGDVAGHAFAPLAQAAERVRRVVVIGPSHHVGFEGLAISSAEAFETPLGAVPVDGRARRELLDSDLVGAFDKAHANEHSLETHLPFLQQVLGAFEIVPVVTGRSDGEHVARLLEAVWGDDETFISISSDLSHFHPYEEARRIDARTCEAIEQMRPEAITREQACGRTSIQGLLVAAGRRGLSADTLDLRNSGDTAGPKDQVVGYGAWAFS
jgi:MEMO1 family protein